jgi:hypothetical protein
MKIPILTAASLLILWQSPKHIIKHIYKSFNNYNTSGHSCHIAWLILKEGGKAKAHGDFPSLKHQALKMQIEAQLGCRWR